MTRYGEESRHGSVGHRSRPVAAYFYLASTYKWRGERSSSRGSYPVRHLRRVGMFAAFLLLLFSGSLTQLAQLGSFLLKLATAHAAPGATPPPPNGKNTYQPVQDKGGTPYRPANQINIAGLTPAQRPPQVIKHDKGHLTPPFDVALDPLATPPTSTQRRVARAARRRAMTWRAI